MRGESNTREAPPTCYLESTMGRKTVFGVVNKVLQRRRFYEAMLQQPIGVVAPVGLPSRPALELFHLAKEI